MTAKIIEFRKPVPQYMMMNEENDSYPVDSVISEILHEGLRRIIANEDREDYIAAANKLICDELGTNIIIHGELGIICVKFKTTIKINNFSGLKQALKGELAAITDQYGFIDYRKLIKIICNADDPRADAVRRHINFRNATDILWEPNKNVSCNRY